MKRQELSIGNFVYCPKLDMAHPFRIYIVDKIRPVVDGDSPYAGFSKDDARVVLLRNSNQYYRKLLGERPGKFIYASELRPIPLNRFFEDNEQRLMNSVSYLGHLIRYSLSVQTKSDAIMEVIFSHSLPRIDKLRWFVDVYDFDGGVSHFPCRYIHQYQNILTALELKSLNFGDFYPYEVEESETK